MLGQLSFDATGAIKDKVELAISRLKAFEPKEGYYLAFSGGKDSQCIYHLAKMAGVKFDAYYSVTSVDPPELVYFIKKNYPDVQFERRYDRAGKPITMWSLIHSKTIPPSRGNRYCCADLKEPGGKGRVVVTGVRWAESIKRRANHGAVDIAGKPKFTASVAEELDIEVNRNKYDAIIMNDDNDKARRLVEMCYRTTKTMVNPIIDWEDNDVWQFLEENDIPHCCLYDEGIRRIGCIGCPLGGSEKMKKDFERWPRYKELYIKAFQKMYDTHKGQVKVINPEYLEERKKRSEYYNKPFIDTSQMKEGEAIYTIWVNRC